MRRDFFPMIMAVWLAVMGGSSRAQQRSDSVSSASPTDATFSSLTSSPLVDVAADWPQYANNPFTFPVSEAVSKDQFFVVDVNGDGLMDFTYRSQTKLYVFDHYGDLLWSANLDNPRADITAGSHDGTGHGAADVDGDGAVEIVALNRSNKIVIYDGTTGAIERTITLPILGSRNKWVYIAVANLRGNGDRDVVLQTMDTSGTKRGVYINRNLLAWDLENNRELWRVRQDDDYTNGINEGYWGVAHGSFQCADVDGDGRDEVIGANMVDDDGRLINLGYPSDWVNAKADGSTDHFDDLCIGDIRPDLPGLEWILVEEENQGSSNFNTTLMTTSGIVWRKMTTLFTGDGREAQNVAVGNFDLGRQHCEVWNRSRFNGDTDSQHPWVFDAFGTQFAHYETGDVLPPGFNTHQNGNKVGIEWIWTIDWDGGARNYIAAKARFVNGNVGIFNALTGAAIWHTTQLSPKTFASIIYVADISGDSREEVIVNDTTGTIRVYWNGAVNPNPPRARKWTNPLYQRTKQNWNSYSPNGYIDNSQLVPPSITLNLPNGGEQWLAGSTQTIRWSSSGGISNVALQLSTDGGNNWSSIVASTANDGSYSWTVTETISSQCLIRVMDATDGSPSDVSDGFFTILAPSPPTLTLTAPNGGESWVAGSSQAVNWTWDGSIPSARLEYSVDNGANWTEITTITTNTASYSWTIPNAPSNQARVRISDATDGDPADVSDGVFVITGPPPSPVISSFTPNSGAVGVEVTILGEHFSGATSVKLNGVPVSAFSIDSATQIRANVPAGATSGKISVTTSSGTTSSANDFTITTNGGGATLSFLPSDDAFVKLSSPTTNNGSANTLRVRKSSSETLYSFLKFSVSGLTGAVQSAKLRFYVADASVDGGAVYAVSNNYLGATTAWTQSGLNWNNAPAITGNALSSIGAVSLGNWVEFEVAPAISGDGVYSFGLKNNSSDVVNYTSKEGSNKPELIIQTSGGSSSTPPSISSFSPTSGEIGVEVTITGQNFSGATAVKFNGITAGVFNVDSDTQILATVPTGASTGKLSVTTSQGTATSTNTFTVNTSGGDVTSVSFEPAHDSYVKLSSPTTNYGSATTLRVRKSGSETLNFYVKFEVSGLIGPIESAKLRLYATDAGNDGGAVCAVLNDYLGTTTAWLQSGLNWNNAPAITGIALGSAGAVSVSSWVEIDVTPAITGNDTYSFGLKNNSSDAAYYGSKETSNQPQLLVRGVFNSQAIVVEFESEDLAVTPEKFSLHQNYPNPFNPETRISYDLPESAEVSLRVYNILGHEVALLVDEEQAAGLYTKMWNGRDKNDQPVSSGIYFYRLQAGSNSSSRKMLLLH